MGDRNLRILTRREFAQRAALLSATALAPANAVLPALEQDASPQSGPQSSEAGQAESTSRYQQIIDVYGNRFDSTQKADLKRMCAEMQPSLDRIRNYALKNGDAPALYLKPIVEREKKPQAAAAPATKKS